MAGRNEEFSRQFDKYRKDPWVMYHGTSPEAANSIALEGFDDDRIGTHYHAEEDGHYFADTPEQAAEYGDAVVAARISPRADIHPAWWMDNDIMHEQVYNGLSLRDALIKHGYHGFTHEDGATVMLHGKGQRFLSGYDTASQSRVDGRSWGTSWTGSPVNTPNKYADLADEYNAPRRQFTHMVADMKRQSRD